MTKAERQKYAQLARLGCILCRQNEKSKYTSAQELFMMNWRGSTVVRINDVDGAIRLVKMLDNHCN